MQPNSFLNQGVLDTFVSELFDKDRANREQNKICFNYAEV